MENTTASKKVAVVTGGTSGIGLEITKMLLSKE
jgi:NAD(P)-dependent dehydrogenase (short-subunit alcohol dehydrogenase family)